MKKAVLYQASTHNLMPCFVRWTAIIIGRKKMNKVNKKAMLKLREHLVAFHKAIDVNSPDYSQDVLDKSWALYKELESITGRLVRYYPTEGVMMEVIEGEDE
jgi:hypothetical protein